MAFAYVRPDHPIIWFPSGLESPVLASQPRPDVDAVFHRGANVGFSYEMMFLFTEAHTATICAVALNAAGRGDNSLLGCQQVSVQQNYFPGEPTRQR